MLLVICYQNWYYDADIRIYIYIHLCKGEILNKKIYIFSPYQYINFNSYQYQYQCQYQWPRNTNMNIIQNQYVNHNFRISLSVCAYV